jgi:hypothetical protein
MTVHPVQPEAYGHGNVAPLRHARKAKEARVITVPSVPHQVTRLVLDAGQPYEKFRSRYEPAVPPADPQQLGDFAGRHARCPDPAAGTGELDPHGFVLYWRADMATPMTTAGECRPDPRSSFRVGRRKGEAIPSRAVPSLLL